MHKTFSNIDDLLAEVVADKDIIGSNASTANRFPIRFVLFDNFRDSYEFISAMSNKDVVIESVDTWMDPLYDDTLISHVELANHIMLYVDNNNGEDCVIAPFSELARLYDNIKNQEFNALVTALKSIQSTNKACAIHQRIYIIVVGQYGKISNFEADPQIFTWYFKSEDKQLNYRLILTNSTDYGVNNLTEKYTIVSTLKEWLFLWRNGSDIKNNIISTSPSIYAFAENAQPDNAFTFCECHNIYEFLTNGLRLHFGNVQYKKPDDEYWHCLAKQIDIIDFSFPTFFKQHFCIFKFSDYNDFLKAWSGCKDNFDKWLLVTYYLSICDAGDYLYNVLLRCTNYSDREVFGHVALTIFDMENLTPHIEARTNILKEAIRRKIILSLDVQNKLRDKLLVVADNYGYLTAVSLMSTLTPQEKALMTKWVGIGKIAICDVKNHFPELYHYMQNEPLPIESQTWLNNYIDKYRQTKLSNRYEQNIDDLIRQHNGSEVLFNLWFQDFKTVRTILSSRKDIDIFYWIDGLGIDWIPYIKHIINEEKNNGIYLNEVIIGKSILPTTTAINRPELDKLSDDKLSKKGDLDNYAHSNTHEYPKYIVDELEIVRKAINNIISEHAGAKIAIVSDHGLTYLSQLCQGLNLAGVTSDHHGRLAVKNTGKLAPDSNYMILPNTNTLCALNHTSLCGKIPTGQGAHGGCTPEEVLVPIFVISSSVGSATWTAVLVNNEITGTNPILTYKITGNLGANVPYLIYAENIYQLNKEQNNTYTSDRIELNNKITDITLCIGPERQTAQLNINVGAQEDDLFDFSH